MEQILVRTAGDVGTYRAATPSSGPQPACAGHHAGRGSTVFKLGETYDSGERVGGNAGVGSEV